MNKRLPSSFRDPHGFLFWKNETLYRQVNPAYGDHYAQLMDSGLYQTLVENSYLIPHQEVEGGGSKKKRSRIIQPQQIPFISYPYEWCFSQLKDAAKITLSIQKKALAFGMTLKDASAFNIQFYKGRPLLIDTLSFKKYREGEPWVAYQQFCQHFLAPLSLMAYRDLRLNRLFQVFLHGIPLDLTSSLLPLRTYLRFSLLTHLHLQAKSQKYYARRWKKERRKGVSLLALKGLVDHLERTVKGLKKRETRSHWSSYYSDLGYSEQGFKEKKEGILDFLSQLPITEAWDLGANTGVFSQLCAEKGITVTAFDVDPLCIERMYSREKGNPRLLPLIMDLTNPTPGIGWNHEERMSFVERGPAQLVLFLALIHHLALGNNLPFSHIASFLHQITQYLIIEYIPREDERAQLLLKRKEEPFPRYRRAIFEEVFQGFFHIIRKRKIRESQRLLYLMKRREGATNTMYHQRHTDPEKE